MFQAEKGDDESNAIISTISGLTNAAETSPERDLLLQDQLKQQTEFELGQKEEQRRLNRNMSDELQENLGEIDRDAVNQEQLACPYDHLYHDAYSGNVKP